MFKQSALPYLLLVCLLTCLFVNNSTAHGIAGDRYFPPTIAVDDPFAAYEAHAIVGRTPNIGASPSNTNNVYSVGGGIEPMDGFGLTLDATYRDPNANLSQQSGGFDNLYFTVKKELEINDRHEFAVTLGLAGQIGGSGTSGSATYSNYAPTIYYAKGFGDLPDALPYLKPLAITGVLGYQIPTDSSQPKFFNYGFTIQYSLLYLQNHVRDIGLAEPLNHMVLVVEFPLQNCLNRICTGQVTGSINPGLVWVGKHFNLSAEAVIPANRLSGTGTGMLFQVHKYLGNE